MQNMRIEYTIEKIVFLRVLFQDLLRLIPALYTSQQRLIRIHGSNVALEIGRKDKYQPGHTISAIRNIHTVLDLVIHTPAPRSDDLTIHRGMLIRHRLDLQVSQVNRID